MIVPTGVLAARSLVRTADYELRAMIIIPAIGPANLGRPSGRAFDRAAAQSP